MTSVQLLCCHKIFPTSQNILKFERYALKTITTTGFCLKYKNIQISFIYFKEGDNHYILIEENMRLSRFFLNRYICIPFLYTQYQYLNNLISFSQHEILSEKTPNYLYVSLVNLNYGTEWNFMFKLIASPTPSPNLESNGRPLSCIYTVK